MPTLCCPIKGAISGGKEHHAGWHITNLWAHAVNMISQHCTTQEYIPEIKLKLLKASDDT